MKISTLTTDNLTIEIIDKILYENIEDNNATVDIILTLGSRFADKYRIPKAVSLYKDQRSNRILMTGGALIPELSHITEAGYMKQKAMELGVPEDSIIIEEQSKTTVENMICSMLILEREFKLINVKSVLLVTTRFHMKRSLLLARAYLPKWIEVIPSPADDVNTLRHNWFQTEAGYKRAIAEASKIISLVKEGSVEDFEI